MKPQTKETLEKLKPKDALSFLKEGNGRFVKNLKRQRNLQDQVIETSEGQFPFAVILSCIDSRVPTELVFDLGIGYVFNIKVAGNIINEDILGSMEYACKVARSKLVVVLGHTKCGAVTAACQNVELGNITPLLKKIEPSVNVMKSSDKEMNDESIEKVAVLNVNHSIKRTRQESLILSEMEGNGEIEIVGAVYNVATGEVEFI